MKWLDFITTDLGLVMVATLVFAVILAIKRKTATVLVVAAAPVYGCFLCFMIFAAALTSRTPEQHDQVTFGFWVGLFCVSAVLTMIEPQLAWGVLAGTAGPTVLMSAGLFRGRSERGFRPGLRLGSNFFYRSRHRVGWRSDWLLVQKSADSSRRGRLVPV